MSTLFLIFTAAGLVFTGWLLHDKYAARLKAWWDEVM